MWDLIQSGGILMIPILGCSIIGLAIVIERLWQLRTRKVIPSQLPSKILNLAKRQSLGHAQLQQLSTEGTLGEILAIGLEHAEYGWDVVRNRMEERGRHCLIELEKYLNILGTIAVITPLLGLLGTVVGMIQMFSALTLDGAIKPEMLAAGISKAMITTAFGLSVAIPCLMFHRFFLRKIEELTYKLEKESLKVVDSLKRAV